MPWYNNDGLLVKFGTEEAQLGRAGTFGKEEHGENVIELKITATDLTTTSAIMDDNVVIPAGHKIRRVDVISDVAVTSAGSLTLSIGQIRLDRTTVVGAATVVSALALSAIAADGQSNTLIIGSSGAGTGLGATVPFPTHITARANTAVATAGKLVVRIYHYKP